MTTTEKLPYWRIDNIFPDVDSKEFRQALGDIESSIAELEEFVTESGMAEGVVTNEREVLERFLDRFDSLQTILRDTAAYLQLRISTNAFDDEARGVQSRLRPLGNRVQTLAKRFATWLGGVDLDALVQDSELAGSHHHQLRRYQILSQHLLTPEAEEIADVLDNTGGGAWAQLHGSLIGRGTIPASLPDRPAGEYNVAELRQLQSEADRDLREAAYRAELELLQRNEVSYAAAMNSIKGQVGELARRRGWGSALDESLFVNAMSRAALDAMQQAVRESFPTFRRYMRAKARHLGLPRLAWYDLFAPVSAGGQEREFGWQEAREFIIDNFAGYSPDLAAFAERAFDEAWLDAPSRKGKVNGAYCMSIPGRQESRIMLNFGGRLDDVFTIAHELGHGFHNDRMYRFERTNLQRTTPMTLAETASIFCETIVMNAMLDETDDRSNLAILEQDLVGVNQIVVDIDSRFRFEDGVFERRAERELSVNEMKELMLAAQDATYGDGLEPEARHELMWAHKGHYYSSGRSYYNYPYTFGLLFGLGVYRVYQAEPEGFQERYDKLLASTGLAPAADLAREFGIDIEDVEFWRASLAVFSDRVAEYERLVDSLLM